jgi:hypothetical protein
VFRAKRSDTKVESIELTYGIDLNARGDMHLGNLLKERGFDSQSQLLDAYYGRLMHHARKRHAFLSFHAEDRAQVQGFRLMAYNRRLALDFYDDSVRAPIKSENATYVRRVIHEKISRASVLICLVGDGTAWREWVDWEIATARELHKGICGVRLKGSRGRTPPGLDGAWIVSWGDVDQITAAIECAAAKRS